MLVLSSRSLQGFPLRHAPLEIGVQEHRLVHGRENGLRVVTWEPVIESLTQSEDKMARPNFSVTLRGSCDLYWACGEPSHFRFTQSNLVSAVSSETVVGTSRRKPSGFMAPTPYTLTAIRTDYATGTCQHKPQGGNIHSTGQFYKGVVGPGSSGGRFFGEDHFNGALTEITVKSDAGLRNAALIAARNKLKSQDINLGVAFGERNQTMRLLGSTATRLSTAVRHLKGGRIRRSMDALGVSNKRRQPRGRQWTDKWLELQYGWKPLLSDVYGAARALEQRPKGDWRVTASVRRSQKDDYVLKKVPLSGANFDACEVKAGLVRSVYTRLDALPQNEAIISLASLGVTNPLSIGWELVPYSFVVDWAYPVGDFLESLDALLGYGSAYYSSSFLAKAKWVDRGLSGSYGTNGFTKNNYTGRKRMVYLSRIVSNSVPLPTLPRFKDPRSLGHMANGLALLASAFGRGSR